MTLRNEKGVIGQFRSSPVFKSARFCGPTHWEKIRGETKSDGVPDYSYYLHCFSSAPPLTPPRPLPPPVPPYPSRFMLGKSDPTGHTGNGGSHNGRKEAGGSSLCKGREEGGWGGPAVTQLYPARSGLSSASGRCGWERRERRARGSGRTCKRRSPRQVSPPSRVVCFAGRVTRPPLRSAGSRALWVPLRPPRIEEEERGSTHRSMLSRAFSGHLEAYKDNF